MHAKNWMFMTIILLLLASCNLPVAESPVAHGVGIDSTAVELTAIARMTELAGTAAATATDTPASTPQETPNPTPCTPLATATTNANIRSGPGTAYNVIGALPVSGTANIAGRNDANSWWYIEFSGGVGGHAWIAGSVVTASCLPANVQIVAAPALPTPQPEASTGSSGSTGNTSDSSGDTSVAPPAAGMPDLAANGMQFSPNPGIKNQHIHIQARVTNNGSALAGQFTVVWLSNQDFPGCSWTVSGLAAGASKSLSCTFTYTTAQYPAASNDFYVELVVDPEHQVEESNEGNNRQDAQLTVNRP